MAGNLAMTYTLIHAFLVKNKHTKAASVLKNSVKDVVVLKDEVTVAGPSLDVIVERYKKATSGDSSDSDSSSDPDSSSEVDSDSSDSSDCVFPVF
ncbi:hypothetical protein DFS33DRAFT_1298311 [Desarmillaria ectypa]|nr:hypothetical protein DFS33DRAFT_1298311 [Desarmillaria ectypa]